MEPQIDPLTALAGRCSGPAWDRLKELRQHALFGLLIRALNTIDGAILDVHVDRLFTELLKHEYNQEKPATTPLH